MWLKNGKESMEDILKGEQGGMDAVTAQLHHRQRRGQ